MNPFRKKQTWPALDRGEIVRRSHVLVIDDQDFPFMELFQQGGYNIEKWDDVDDLARLERGEFDVVLVDLYGVGTAQSADQGFGILEHLRQVRPAQILVAYSNAAWELDNTPRLGQADAVLHKTKNDYFDFKRTVDDLLEKRFSMGFYVERATAELGDFTATAPKAPAKVRDALQTGRTEGLRRYLASHVEDKLTIDRVLQIVQVGIAAAGLWKH